MSTVSSLHDLQISESQKNVGSNHAVSGLKFKILQRFLKLGYAVLLSDVDIIVLRDPFDFLFKDSDVESMSDGWNNQTAYGILLSAPLRPNPSTTNHPLALPRSPIAPTPPAYCLPNAVLQFYREGTPDVPNIDFWIMAL